MTKTITTEVRPAPGKAKGWTFTVRVDGEVFSRGRASRKTDAEAYAAEDAARAECSS